MAEQFKQLITCKLCDWTGRSRQALYAHKKAHHPESFAIAPLMPQTPQPIPAPPQPAPMPTETPPLTPKEQYEKEHNVKIPDLVDDEEDETPADAAKFDGDDPEIPYFFIMLAVIALMLISGAVIFRERIIVLLQKKKVPQIKPILENDIYE